MIPSAAYRRSEEAVIGRTFSARGIGRVAVLIWHSEVTLDGARAISSVFADLQKRPHAGGLGFLTILEAGTDIRPSPEARHAVAQVLRDYGKSIGAAAIAYEADGFKATIVRSVITAINLASSTRFPNRVFSESHAAIEWLATALDDNVLAAELRTGISQLRGGAPHQSGHRSRAH